jgi:hypothetical protein
MAGFLSFLTGGGGDLIKGGLEGLGGLAKDLRGAITGEISPEKKAEIETKILDIEATAKNLQAQINIEEAKHKSIFVAGWRPFIGWTCGVALAYNYVITPLAVQLASLWNKTLALAPLDIGSLITLLIGMLGIAGLRTIEKNNGTSSVH